MKYLLSMLTLLLILVGLAPFVDGLLFKDMYLKRLQNSIETYQLKSDDNIKFDYSNYKLGWLSSTYQMKVTVTIPDKSKTGLVIPPITLWVNTTIKHGPLFYNPETHAYQWGYAFIDTNVPFPDIMKALVFSNSQALIHMDAVQTFDTTKLFGHTTFAPFNFANKFKFNGITSSGVINYDHNNFNSIIGSINFQGFTLVGDDKTPAINLAPIHYQITSNIHGTSVTTGNSSLTTKGITFDYKGKQVSLKNISNDSTFDTNNVHYQYQSSSQIGQIQFPDIFGINQLNNTKIGISLQNLDVNAMNQFCATYNSHPPKEKIESLLKTILAGATIEVKALALTNDGPVQLVTGINFHPEFSKALTNDEQSAAITVDVSARANDKLVANLLTNYLKQTNPATPVDAQKELNELITQKVITQEKTDYTIHFVKSGKTFILNNVDVTKDFGKLKNVLNHEQQVKAS